MLDQLAGSVPVDAVVDDSICAECERHSLFAKGHLNPVVASLLLTRTSAEDSPVDWVRARQQQLNSFAIRHLENVDAPPPNESATIKVRDRGCANQSRPRVGLVGWATRTGLGYQNLEIAKELSVDRWLIATDQSHPVQVSTRGICETQVVEADCPPGQLAEFLRDLDWLIFAETEYVKGISNLAQSMGVRVACIPMHESFCIGQCDWMHDIDLVICPTHFTYNLVSEFRRQFCFEWSIAEVSWPIDRGPFPFRLRETCRSFLFVNGTGGLRPFDVYGNRIDFHRKGLEIVLAAAALAPEVPIVITSQVPIDAKIPPNVRVIRGLTDQRSMYDYGDVCIQPSLWEGIGRQLLECQAAGLPLITTAAPPMDEFRPFKKLSVERQQIVKTWTDQPITANFVSPQTLADAIRSILGKPIDEASQLAFENVSRHHCWSGTRSAIAELLTFSTIQSHN